jgi:hypothetical protein
MINILDLNISGNTGTSFGIERARISVLTLAVKVNLCWVYFPRGMRDQEIWLV